MWQNTTLFIRTNRGVRNSKRHTADIVNAELM